MIHVSHNPDTLPYRRVLRTRNPKAADRLIRAMMTSKQPRGMRLRYTVDVVTGLIDLSGRCSEPIRVAHRVLRDAGLVR